jgi:ribosomal protein S6--L-glutamate ligase
MNIAILSRGESLYSTQSLLRAGEARDHEMEVLDPSLFTLSIEKNTPSLLYGTDIIDDIDAIIPRIGASNTYMGSSLVRHFETMKVFTTVRAQSILQSRNKWTSFQILALENIPVPKTILGNVYDAQSTLKTFNNKPVIIKVLQGTHGAGVILADTYRAAISTIETLNASKVRFVIQEYIAESKGADIRAIIVDGVVVAAIKRQGKKGEFRSNLHLGGSSEVVQLSNEESQIAIAAAQALKLGVCGVDILQSSRGPLILEINSTPGLEGAETATGIDISKNIIEYIERNNS